MNQNPKNEHIFCVKLQFFINIFQFSENFQNFGKNIYQMNSQNFTADFVNPIENKELHTGTEIKNGHPRAVH